MKICLKCRRQLFDSDTVCDKCKSTIIMDKVQFDILYSKYKSSTEEQQQQLRMSPEYKEFCEYVFPAVKKPTLEEREEQRKITKEKEILKRKQEQAYVKTHSKQIEPAKRNVPTCPICQSTDLSKITTTKKVAKIAVFGILGLDDTGKTWKCNNCGSKF